MSAIGFPVSGLSSGVTMSPHAIDVLVWGRVVERLLDTVAGITSLVLGWNLFRVGVITEQSAELELHTLSVKLQKVGPGVFFALFGTALLVYGVSNPLSFVPTGRNEAIRYMNSLPDQYLRPLIFALNTPINLIEPRKDQKIPPADLSLVADARSGLIEVRKLLLTPRFGTEAIDLWDRKGDEFESTPLALSAQERATLAPIAPWMTTIIGEKK